MFTMRSAGLFALLGLLCSSTALALDVHCYDDPLEETTKSNLTTLVQSALKGPVLALCDQEPLLENDGVLKYDVGTLTFRLKLEKDHDTQECKIAFEKIVDKCVVSQGVFGGEVEGEDSLYEIFDSSEGHGEHDHDDALNARDAGFGDFMDNFFGSIDDAVGLEKRRGSRGGSRGSRGRGRTRTRTRKTRTSIKPVKTPHPPTSKKPAPTTTKNPVPTTSKKPVSPTSKKPLSSTSKKPQPTQNCKQIIALAEKANKKEIRRDLSAVETEIDGSIVQRDSNALQKRTPKTGQSCGKTFNAFDYPEPGHSAMTGANAYDFKYPGQCKRMEWGRAPNAPAPKYPEYNVEHVLEWQLVTKFFDWVQETYYSNQARLDSLKPLTQSTATVKFCDLWLDFWEWDVTIDGNTRTAKEHIKWAFPSKKAHIDEFVWLESNMNSPSKEGMWHKKNTGVILGQAGLSTQIRTPGNALPAAMRLKWVMGARKYQKNPHIERTFSKQKWRIGEVLHKIEQAFMTNQRRTSGGNAYRPWVQIDLRQRWNDYMDERFEEAKSRTQRTMDNNIADLERRYVTPFKRRKPAHGTPQYDRMTTIKALATEWRKEKRSKWVAPWVRRRIRPDGTLDDLGVPATHQIDNEP